MSDKPASQPLSPSATAVDSFGCPFDKLYKNQTLDGADIRFFRKGTRDALLEQVKTPPSDRGFAIGVSTLAGHTRRIFRRNEAASFTFTENSIYIRDLSEAYKADLGGPFDFVLLEISPASLARIADEAELPAITALMAETASKDIVLANLVRALIPALEKPEEASTLFVEQMATAIGTYLVQRYGGKVAVPETRARKLSRAHEVLAKNMLVENLDGDIAIHEVAHACNLSRGYFIRAFRDTTGMTPYQWLINERIGRARALLKDPDVSLFDVAISCGFADQSHFTRVFTTVVGTSPGNWRRNA